MKPLTTDRFFLNIQPMNSMAYNIWYFWLTVLYYGANCVLYFGQSLEFILLDTSSSSIIIQRIINVFKWLLLILQYDFALMIAIINNTMPAYRIPFVNISKTLSNYFTWKPYPATCQVNLSRLSWLPAPLQRYYTTVMGIETSCDDTGVAIVDDRGRLLGDALQSQSSIHKTWVMHMPIYSSIQLPYLYNKHPLINSQDSAVLYLGRKI